MAELIFYTAEQEERARKLIADLEKPTFVFRMARAKLENRGPLGRSAQHSYARAIRDINKVIEEIRS
jgi:hypothetical protein